MVAIRKGVLFTTFPANAHSNRYCFLFIRRSKEKMRWDFLFSLQEFEKRTRNSMKNEMFISIIYKRINCFTWRNVECVAVLSEQEMVGLLLQG